MSNDEVSGQGVSGGSVPRLSEGRFRALFANVADMVTISDRSGGIIYASPATEKVSGYTPEEFMARNPFDQIHPEDRPRCEEAMARLARTPGLSLELEHRVRHKDGTWRWVEGTFTSLFDDPDVGGLLATVRDITERKQAEEALRASEARQTFLLDLGDRVRGLTDAAEIAATTAEALGRHLGVARCLYGEVNPTDEYFRVERDWTDGTLASMAGGARFDDSGVLLEVYRTSRTLVVDDTGEDGRTTGNEEAYAGTGAVRSAVGVPLIKGGRFAAAFGVHHTEPRAWTSAEVALIEDVAERTWAALERARAEEALRDSRVELERQMHKFDVTLSTINDYVFSFDRDGRFLYANRALLDLWGLTTGEEVGKDLAELNYPPDLRQQLLDYLRHIFGTGETIRDETPYTTPGGVAGHYEYSMGPAFASDGTVEYVVGSSRDVTGRKWAAEQSRRVAELDAFRVALSDVLRPLTDPDEIQAEAARVLGEHLGANRVVYAEIDGVENEGSTVATITQGYASDVPPLTGRFKMGEFGLNRAMPTHAERVIVADVRSDPSLTEDEKARYAEISINAWVGVPLVKGGRFVAALGVHQREPRDWTPQEIALVGETAERTWGAVEHARAEEALRESEERLQKAIAIDTVGVLFFDLDGHITDANEAFSRMTGYSREELIESVSWELITPSEFAAATTRATGELATRGETAPYEKQFVRKDGSRLWSLCAPRRLSGSGRASRCVEFILDITERKRFEAESARLRSREAAMRAETAERERISRELHDRVAHSMGVVYQNLQLHRALAENNPERARGKLATADETARNALDQTRNLAIELRRSVSSETENGVATALRTLIETSVPDGVEAGLSFSGDESTLPRDIGAQVYLVMREAIRNALKHSGCEELQASLEVHPAELVGTVSDDGDGFDPGTISDDGRGIGLRSMRERAEMMGGELELTSHPGDGTTVEIRVPLAAD